MPSIVIRPATHVDASAVAEAKRSSAVHTYRPLIGSEAFEVWADKRCSPEFQIARIDGPGLTIVTSGPRVSALGFVRPELLHGEPGGVYLGDLYVVDTGVGVGSRLLAELSQQARRLGSYIWTLVFEENTAARDWFESRGWVLVGSRPNGEVPGSFLCEFRKNFSNSYTLVGPNGVSYVSDTPGRFGGFAGSSPYLRIYGRLDCSSARSQIRRGGYIHSRVFFASEADAVAAGFRPCGRCMPEEYRTWKASQSDASPGLTSA